MGDWFNLIASTALVGQLTNQGTAISYIFLARFLPLFVFSPIAGVWADRYNRQHIMVAADVMRAVVVLGFLWVREPSHIWLLYLLTIAQFMLSALFTPARSAVIANIVDASDLVTANALDSLTWSSMLAIGSLLGGIVAALFGGRTAFVADAGTFLFSAWLISQITIPRQLNASMQKGQERFRFVGGMKYLWGVPALLTISLIKGAGSLVWGGINVLEVNFANQLFPLNIQLLEIDGGTMSLGIIYAISGIGTGIGPLLVRQWFGDTPKKMYQAITWGFIWLSGGIFLLSTAPNLWFFLAATLIRTIGSGTVWVFSAALLQTLLPDHVRGRVFAFEFTFLTLTQSLAIFTAGWIQDGLGWTVQQTAIGIGGLGLFMLGWWLLFYLLMSREKALAVEPTLRAD